MAASAAATRSPERTMQRVVATTPLGDATNRGMTSSSSHYLGSPSMKAVQLDDVELSPRLRASPQKEKMRWKHAMEPAEEATLDCLSDCSTISAPSSSSHSLVGEELAENEDNGEEDDDAALFSDPSNESLRARSDGGPGRKRERNGAKKVIPVFFGTPSKDEHERRAKYNNLNRRLLRTDSLDLARRRSVGPSQNVPEVGPVPSSESVGPACESSAVSEESIEGHLAGPSNHQRQDEEPLEDLDGDVDVVIFREEKEVETSNEGAVGSIISEVNSAQETGSSIVRHSPEKHNPLETILQNGHLTSATSLSTSPRKSPRRSPHKSPHRSSHRSSPAKSPSKRSPRKEGRPEEGAPSTPTVRDMLKSWAATIVQSPTRSSTKTSPKKEEHTELQSNTVHLLELARQVPLPESPEKPSNGVVEGQVMEELPMAKGVGMANFKAPLGVASVRRTASRSSAGPSARLASAMSSRSVPVAGDAPKPATAKEITKPSNTVNARLASKLPVPASQAVKRSGIPVGRPPSSLSTSGSSSGSSMSSIKTSHPAPASAPGFSSSSRGGSSADAEVGSSKGTMQAPAKSKTPLQRPKSTLAFRERVAMVRGGASNPQDRDIKHNGPFPPSHKPALHTQARERPHETPLKEQQRSVLSASASQVEQLLGGGMPVNSSSPKPLSRPTAARDPRIAHTKPATRVWDSPAKKVDARSPQRRTPKATSPVRSMRPPPPHNAPAATPTTTTAPSLPFSSGSGRARRVLVNSSEPASSPPRAAARITFDSHEGTRALPRIGQTSRTTNGSEFAAIGSGKGDDDAIAPMENEMQVERAFLRTDERQLGHAMAEEPVMRIEKDDGGAAHEAQPEAAPSELASVVPMPAPHQSRPHRQARIVPQRNSSKTTIFAVPTPSLASTRPLSQAEWSQKTKANTRRNEVSVIAIDKITIRRPGERPPSPSSKFLKAQSPGEELVNSKRFAGSDDEDLSDDDSTEEIENHLSSVSRHRRRAGEEDRYETPPRIRFAPSGCKAVRWQKQLFQGPCSSSSSSSIGSVKSCLAPKTYNLDRFGNVVGADQPLPSRIIAKQKVTVHRIVYDGEDEE
ncbi:hypothetical protein FA10DRAFT_284422 [Acaromyces ingoldii]|uniref:Uncharacterized protein n=1 Tax=Acaromyces ingoldii TaxID=215250 RepID=A0A316YPM6_9BASI|nr:hypothetical protein FA10DRAFT_284422 [Acaromyces ingoldii]PWN91490.1 hypothetical protein FA10DRAFT_284422 [Acaromyces ingoldii]